MGWLEARRTWSFSVCRGSFHVAGALAAALTLALVIAAAAPVSAASPTACRVRNLDSQKTFGSLQRAVDNAKAGQHLTVRGTCHGAARIDQSLTITGIRTKTSGRPTLDGDRGASGNPSIEVWCTLWTTDCREGLAPLSVKIRDLTIREMYFGIENWARLNLRDVTIRGSIHGIENHNRVSVGGSSRIMRNEIGIYSRYGGGVTLRGASQVVDNRSPEEAAGIVTGSALTMNDSSTVTGNTSGAGAGGVDNYGTMTMNDSSRVTDNEGRAAGGVWNMGGLLIMRRSSAITGNEATDGVGGVLNEGTLDGVRWPPAAKPNVHHNKPGNVAQP